jgi:flagellar protein FlbD
MIVVTRLNGPTFALNPDLIERVEANPDTVVVLIGGASYPIAESVSELLDRVRDYRSQVIASAHAAEFPADQQAPVTGRGLPGAERKLPGAERKLHSLPKSDAE